MDSRVVKEIGGIAPVTAWGQLLFAASSSRCLAEASLVENVAIYDLENSINFDKTSRQREAQVPPSRATEGPVRRQFGDLVVSGFYA